MSFDVRLPIGLLFLAIGVLVGGYGAVAAPMREGLNIDLVWGLVMAGFGALMLAMVWLRRKGDPMPPEG